MTNSSPNSVGGLFLSQKRAADSTEIRKRIPHRFPFVFIDRILDVEEGKCCVALKNITYNEPLLQGHFPESPVFPGVLIIEAMAQTAAIAGYALYKDPEKESAVFTGLDKVKFRKPVLPGDQLVLKAKIMKRKMNIWFVKGEAFVGKELAAVAELKLAVVSMP